VVTSVTGDGTMMTYQVGAGTGDLPRDRARIIECLRQDAEITGQPVAIPDLGKRRLQVAAAGQEELAGCAIGTGYLVGETLSGHILFGNTSPMQRVFADVDIEILQLMAQWLGDEIDRIEINRRAQEHQSHLAHVSRLNTMGEMATGIAHELNQPLTAILNYSNGSIRLIQKRDDAGSELEDAIKNIGKDARRAADIIKRLREFIKRGEHRPERFLLRSCIEPAVELLRPRLIQHGIEVSLEYAADVSDIVADRIQIEQVLVNLLLNAIDALQNMGHGSRNITVHVDRAESGGISVAVSDSGEALHRSVAEHLFDPFFTTKTEGMGMGLSISRSIVEAHGGTIEYRLNELRQPTFRFTLPET
jgi:two-component system, LuxR family, sensor kinase FixL